jgi:formylglycine-generating enzyme required for sulfatase activity
VSDFRLDTYEVTVGRFRKFVAAYSQGMIPAGAGKNPNDPTDAGWNAAWSASLPPDATARTGGANCLYPTWTAGPAANESKPMNCITWYEALAFCIWDGGRLPTEAEWNYAAAGGSEQRVYPWGAVVPGVDAKLAVYGCNYDSAQTCGVSNVAPAGLVSAGNGKWGQADLAGNVREWARDSYANPYTPGACHDCTNATVAPFRVIRGGSFLGLSSYLFSSYRSGNDPADHNSAIGARCAR